MMLKETHLPYIFDRNCVQNAITIFSDLTLEMDLMDKVLAYNIIFFYIAYKQSK